MLLNRPYLCIVAMLAMSQVLADVPVETVGKSSKKTSSSSTSTKKLTVGDRLIKIERQLQAWESRQYQESLSQLEAKIHALEGKLSEIQHSVDLAKKEQDAWSKSFDQQLSAKTTEKEIITNTQDIELYEAALASIKQKKYPQALEQLKNFIETHPTSKHVPTSYYWMAEAYLLQQQHDSAEKSLLFVLDNHQDHTKVPDVLLKLVMLYSHQNKPELAKRYFTQLQQNHDKSPAAISGKKQFAHFDT